MRDLFTALCNALCVCALVAGVWYFCGDWAGSLVQASDPVAVSEHRHSDSSCCLIPANRGLYR